MSKMRPRMTRDQWAALIEQQPHSGLNIEAFCQEHDIGFASFGKWKRRLSTCDAESNHTTQQPAFKALRVNDLPSAPTVEQSTTITLSIGTGITLTIANPTVGS